MLLGAGVLATVSAAPAASKSDPNEAVRTALQAELDDFSVPGWDKRTEDGAWPVGAPFVPEGRPATLIYRGHLKSVADWGPSPVWHQMGFLPVTLSGGRSERLGVNVFFPQGPSKGTLLFVHGYMSHAANFAYTFSWFVARGWTVTTLDLPGHGLSTGPRADVASFADYGDAVRTWLDWAFAQPWPGPRVLLAHSLGSAACLEALRRPGTPRPDQIVFCAPLLRTDWYPALQAGEAALGWAVREFPSRFGWDGYLDGYVMPLHWFRALGSWLDSLTRQRPLDLPLTIYSGDKDDVVDEGWNRTEYSRLVPGARYVVLPGKGHLFLSNREDREAFHKALDALLTQAGLR